MNAARYLIKIFVETVDVRFAFLVIPDSLLEKRRNRGDQPERFEQFVSEQRRKPAARKSLIQKILGSIRLFDLHSVKRKPVSVPVKYG